MSLAFLSPDLATAAPAGGRPVARAPVEQLLRRLGARHELREGWSIPVSVGAAEAGLHACTHTVALADRWSLGKLELQGAPPALAGLAADAAGAPPPQPGTAARVGDAWWCPLSPERLLALCPPGATRDLRERLAGAAAERPGVALADLTSAFGAIAVAGPLARELLARLTSLDLREEAAPERSFRPGAFARIPAMVLRERADAYLVLFGAAYGEYLWTVALDAAAPLGGATVGLEVLEQLTEGASDA